jgi:hypothetical protein
VFLQEHRAALSMRQPVHFLYREEGELFIHIRASLDSGLLLRLA